MEFPTPRSEHLYGRPILRSPFPSGLEQMHVFAAPELKIKFSSYIMLYAAVRSMVSGAPFKSLTVRGLGTALMLVVGLLRPVYCIKMTQYPSSKRRFEGIWRCY